MYEDRFHMWGFTASGRLVRRPLAARRGWEQGKLTGLRRNVSLALEMMDVSWPVVHALAMRIKDAVTWLLVSIIGQSLGLVAAGIRESMRRGSNEGAEQAAAQRGQHKAEEQRTPKGGGDPWGNGAFVF